MAENPNKNVDPGWSNLTFPTYALEPWHICCHTWASHTRDTYSLTLGFSFCNGNEIDSNPRIHLEVKSHFSPVAFLLEKLSTSEADWGGIKHGSPGERPLLQRKNILGHRYLLTSNINVRLTLTCGLCWHSIAMMTWWDFLSNGWHLHHNIPHCKISVGNHHPPKLLVTGHLENLDWSNLVIVLYFQL